MTFEVVDMTMSIPNTVAGIGRNERDDAAQAEFDALFRSHQPRLVESLTLVAGDRELAADAVQEAFVRAHQRWRRVRRYDDPIGWVRRVAINRLKDEHRRSRRKRVAIGRLSTEPTYPVEPVFADDDLRRQLAELPRQQRLCIVLRYVDDLSVAEIASTLGVADGTVKSNLHDARARLRRRLSPAPTPAGPPVAPPVTTPPGPTTTDAASTTLQPPTPPNAPHDALGPHERGLH
ncbi:MAG: SigE family RNA polymerase sigma factor [Actinomycetota bacterium]